jgi:hypothetical protein
MEKRNSNERLTEAEWKLDDESLADVEPGFQADTVAQDQRSTRLGSRHSGGEAV